MATAGKFLSGLAIAGMLLAASGAAVAQDASCMARCQALESQCLQASKGDSAKCNAVATQCFRGCRAPR